MSDTTADRIGWGILATGGIADQFTRDLRTAGLHVAAVGSRTEERAREFAATHDIPNAHGSWEALAADPTVDVVYVATPHPAHAPAALTAIAGGKHVLVEKPFTLNAAEAEQVVLAGEQAGVLVLEAMWTRWLPHILEIRDLIAEGAIGTPQLLIADHTQSISRDPAHRLNAPELGGGALLDLGIYPVSYAVDLFGLPESFEVTAAFTPDTGVDRRLSASLVHAGDANTVFTTASDLAGPNTATIVGTEGTIAIDPVWYSASGYTVRNTAREVVAQSHPRIEGRGMQYQALEVERLLREGRTTSDRLPPAESVAIMRLLDDLRERIGLVYPQERDETSA